MKILFRLLFIYLLFLIQTSIGKVQIDLVLLGLVIFSLYDPPFFAVIMGLWSGILIGLVNPVNFGFNIIILTIIAFSCNNIRRYIYKDKIYFLSVLFLALFFKYIVCLIFLQTRQGFLTWLILTAVVMIIAVPVQMLIIKIFFRQWRMNVVEDI